MDDLIALGEVAASDLVVGDHRSSLDRLNSFRRFRGYGSLNRSLGNRHRVDVSVAKDRSWAEGLPGVFEAAQERFWAWKGRQCYWF